MSAEQISAEDLFRSINQVIQGELTSLLYTFRDESARKINTFIEIILNMFWKLICTLYYDINVYSENPININEQDNRLDIWNNFIRFYLKGGKAMKYVYKEATMKENLNRVEKKAVDKLLDKDSDWDTNLLIIDDKNFDEIVADFKFFIFKVVYFFMLGFIYKDYENIDEIYNYISSYRLDLKTYDSLIQAQRDQTKQNQIIAERELVSSKIRKFQSKNDEIKKILINEKKEIEDAFGKDSTHVFFDKFKEYIFANRQSIINKLDDIKPTADRVATMSTFNPTAKIFLKNARYIVDLYIECFNSRELFDLISVEIGASASNIIEIDADNAFYLCRFFYKMDAFNAFQKILKQKDPTISNIQIRELVSSMRTFAEMIDVGIPVKYTGGSDSMRVERAKFIEDEHHSTYDIMIQPIPFLQNNIFVNSYMFPIPKIYYHVADNLRMVQSISDPKIVKRCQRLVDLLDILCMSESVDVIHDSNFIIRGTTLDNAKQGPQNPCYHVVSFLFSCCDIRKSYVITTNNQTEFFGNAKLQDVLSASNIKSIHFYIDTIKFATFYQDYCKSKNLEWKGVLTSKIDIVLQILNLTLADIASNKLNKTRFYTLMKFSKKDLFDMKVDYDSLIEDLRKLLDKDNDFYFRSTDAEKQADIQKLYQTIQNYYLGFIDNLKEYVEKNSGILRPPRIPTSIKDYSKKNIFVNNTVENTMNNLIKAINPFDMYYFLNSLSSTYKLYLSGGYSFSLYMNNVRNVYFPTADIDVHYIRLSNAPYDKAQATQEQYNKAVQIVNLINSQLQKVSGGFNIVRIDENEQKNIKYFNNLYNEKAIYFPPDPCYAYLVTIPVYSFPVYKVNVVIGTGKSQVIEHFMEIFFLDQSDTVNYDQLKEAGTNRTLTICSIKRQIVNYVEAYMNKTKIIPLKWYKYGRRLSTYFNTLYSTIQNTPPLAQYVQVYRTKNYTEMTNLVTLAKDEPVFKDFREYYTRYFMYRLASSIGVFQNTTTENLIYNRLFNTNNTDFAVFQDLANLISTRIMQYQSANNLVYIRRSLGEELYNNLVLNFQQGANINTLPPYIISYVELRNILMSFETLMVLRHYSVYNKEEKYFIFS